MPAMILFLSESISFAYCLASVGNVLVCLASRVPRGSFGTSTKTNQRSVTVRLAMVENLYHVDFAFFVRYVRIA